MTAEMSGTAMVISALLAASLVMLFYIRAALVEILIEMRKRNYIQDLTNKVMAVTRSENTELTKMTPPSETSNPQDESGQQSSTR